MKSCNKKMRQVSTSIERNKGSQWSPPYTIMKEKTTGGKEMYLTLTPAGHVQNSLELSWSLHFFFVDVYIYIYR